MTNAREHGDKEWETGSGHQTGGQQENQMDLRTDGRPTDHAICAVSVNLAIILMSQIENIGNYIRKVSLVFELNFRFLKTPKITSQT